MMATRGSYNKRKNNIVSTRKTFKINREQRVSPNLNESNTSQAIHSSNQDTKFAPSKTIDSIKTQPATKNFSSRNSLRTAQTFSVKSQQTIATFTMPNIADFNANDYFNLERGVDSTDFYQILSSDTFFIATDHFICVLCGSKERLHNNSHHVHLSSELHTRRYNDLQRSLVQQVPNDSSLQMNAVRELINVWYQNQILTDDMILSRFSIIHEFNAILNSVMPECNCRILGSMVTGTPLRSSDINLELIHPNSHLFEGDPRAKNSIHHKLIDPNAAIGYQVNNHTLHYDLIANPIDTLFKVMNAIENQYQGFPTSSFRVISDLNDLNAKVPKLILLHENSRTKLQVCCYAESSHKLAVLLGTYLSFDARASILSVIVKYWAKICKIDNPDSGTYPSDVYIILVIYYLQRTSPPILPCLHEIIYKNSKNGTTHNSIEKTALNQFKKLNINENRHSSNPNASRNNLPEIDGTDLNVINSLEVMDDVLEDEIDDEEEDDDFITTDSEIIKNFDWISSNETPVYKLFLDFLDTMSKEFDDYQNVISIRTLKKVSLRNKRYITQVKAIENPVKPKANISRCVGTARIFSYIRQCFTQSHQYLTCLPMDHYLHARFKKNGIFNPSDYTDFYVMIERLQFYFQMKKDSIRNDPKADPITEMIRQNIFARDVETINNLFDRAEALPGGITKLPATVTKFYDMNCLIPRDAAIITFCWTCKGTGHTKQSCFRANIDSLSKEIESYDMDLDITADLDLFFIALYNRDKITTQLSKAHANIVAQLETMINTATGLNCRLNLFGSTVNDLGSSDSDLDICLTLDDNPTGLGVNCVDVLDKVHSVLIKDEQVSLVEPILSARVPIIKFKYSHFDVDLSMYNLCAIYNSRLLKAYSKIDKRVAQLFYLVKRYAKACKIADASRGSLSSYAWSLLVIHYLQQTQPPILPVLQEAPPGAQKELIGVNGWNVWFREDFECPMEPRNGMTLTQLFKGFLIYYSTFEFNFYVVSIRKQNRITRFQKNWNNCAMAIEDPFELTYNLASRLDEPMAVYIINSFALAFRNIVDIQSNYRQHKHQNRNHKFNQTQKLFNSRYITNSNPPYRGCRACHRIGHRVQDCPERQNNRNQENRQRTRTT